MMRMLNNIFNKIKESAKAFLLLIISLFLCSCDDCPTYQDYLNEGIGDNCLLCGLFDVLTDAATVAANKSWGLFAESLQTIVILATVIYMAFQTLKMVGSMGKQDTASYLMADKKGLIMLGFKMAVIVLLLGDTFFVDRIIAPILEAGLTIGLTLGPIENMEVSFSGESGWSGLFSGVNNAVKGYNDQVYSTIAMGQTMICVSTDGFILSWYWLMLLYGFIFFIFGWFTLAAVCFYIIDVIITLTFGAILLPFGIAFAVSHLTSRLSTKIWNTFLNAFFSFVILGVILGLSDQMIKISIGDTDEGNIDIAGENSFSAQAIKMLNSNNAKKVSEMLWSSGSLLLTIISFCLLINIIEGIKSLVQKVSSTDSLTDSGSKTGAAVTSPIAKGGKKAGAYIGNATKNAVQDTGHAISRITRLDKGIDRFRDKMSTAQGVLTGTGRKGYKAFWRK